MAITPPSLLARLRQPNDQVAWERMVAIYTPLLRDWFNSQRLPKHELDDLVQDVLVVVCRKLPKFVGGLQSRHRLTVDGFTPVVNTLP